MQRAIALAVLTFAQLQWVMALTATAPSPEVRLEAQSRELAEAACRAAQARKGDCNGGLVWVEHLNIVVGDRRTAERFYFEEGLGCTRDPRKPGGATQPTGTMWANLGAQQFHLAEEAPDDPPQAVHGSIGLAVPRALETARRLEAQEGVAVEVHDEHRFTVTCPWGNVFHCYDVETYRASLPVDAAAGPKMVAMHQNYDADGRFAVRGVPGIRYVHLKCPDAKAAARAYARVLGAFKFDDDAFAVVSAGVGPVHLVFESASRDVVAETKMNGVHACVYVDNFAARYADLEAHIFTNPRFRHLDTCDTLEEALASRTFRFILPEAPFLEHETRSLAHANFLQHIAYER
ncbi:hypothetical protein CTAYLR_005735 [Chrysophaeum taylorii]|uniref:VOC domain-containing protein n=1 Tax=Chrysophaeum taylorii TaxID=2483200 RepID=A0AAD7UL92_9STRA|nr:hypothetical protein CTAYLR_005735 [Chrysophaeum taylorii]